MSNAVAKRAAGWLAHLRRSWKSGPRRLLRVCENVSLGARSSINVVQFGQQRFLLGVTDGSLALLATLAEPDSGGAPLAACPPPSDETRSETGPTWVMRDGCYRREP